MKKCIMFLLLSYLLSASPVLALPILAIDANPAVPGIQSEVQVSLGDSISIDVIVSGVVVPFTDFMVDIVYDPSVLLPTGAVEGNFASELIFGYFFRDPNFIRAGAFSTGLSSGVGSGILFSLTFDAVGIGESELIYDRVVDGIAEYQRFGATIQVNGPEPVPEPATMFLLGAGLIGLAGLRRKFRK